ncbi:MAG: rhomboid family intramembrane serine protease [Pseudomonadales bacterium]|nr:rhomboid family intramembrane serine protease [Pseudomonadales bacterium]
MMKLALSVKREVDLSLFSQYLWQQQIAHRVNEAGNEQELWVTADADVEIVTAAYAKFSSGEMTLKRVENAANVTESGGSRLARLVWSFMKLPVTLFTIVITVLFYPIAWGIEFSQFGAWFSAMTFVPFELTRAGLVFGSASEMHARAEYWRLLSPMFIHFSLLHIVFNLLWFWELGRRIESDLGSAELVLIMVATSLCANVMQYVMTGPSLFGGMSGVVFGLLGFTLVWSRMLPARSIAMPDAVYIFMFVFLALGFFGVIDLLQLGSMANGAHLGGLLAGLLLGAAFALLERPNPKQSMQ